VAAETIDDVIGALDAIVDRAWNERSRIGYFAALYQRVTRSVQDGVAAGRFQNGPLLERLDVVFANRYLDALRLFQSAQRPSRSWVVAFEAAGNPLPLVLQQLLAGMNAHINLDLGIAAAETAPGDQLPALESDFNEINAVLAEQVGTVQQEIAEVSPMIALLEKLGLRTETRIINFSLQKARDLAWVTAQMLASAAPGARDARIRLLDLEVELLGQAVVHPAPPVGVELAPIRAAESNDIRRILDVLARSGPSGSLGA
jgi:hypothetical protein